MKFFIKLDRLASWVLFLGLIAYFVSGYGMTKGFVDPAFAAKMHTQVLTYIIAVAFVVHTSFAIRLTFMRWGIWNVFTKILLVAFYLLFVIFVLWVDKFYVKPSNEGSVLSLQEISKHNNASDCWMIVNNKVYNLSSYINSHSGGVGTILPYCGKDGTNAYATKDGRGQHKPNDINILNSYYIGDLNQTVQQDNILNSQEYEDD